MFGDAPADAGDRFGVRAVPVQHSRRSALPNGVLVNP
jgi:hypothetical protein